MRYYQTITITINGFSTSDKLVGIYNEAKCENLVKMFEVKTKTKMRKVSRRGTRRWESLDKVYVIEFGKI